MSIRNGSNWPTSAAQSQGTGGAPYNVLIDLAILGARFPLFAAGFVGNDPLGEEDSRRLPPS